MRPSHRSLLINISLAVGTALVCITVGEVALRVMGIEKGHVSPPLIYQRSSNPSISYELKPSGRTRAFRSTITTNSKGFRSPEPDPSKKTLAVLGDSITFGYGVENEKTLPSQLQKLLPDYNFLNAGVPSYNLVQEAATYTQKIAPLNPAGLILVFYWNDLHDLEPAVLADDGNLREKGQEGPSFHCAPIIEGIMGWIPGKCWLDTHSSIYRVLKKLIIAKTIKAS